MKIITYALEKPLLTNLGVALAGTLLILSYAILFNASEPINIFNLATIQASALKILAVFCKEIGLAALVAVIINFSIEGFNRKRHEAEKDSLIASINNAHATQRDAQIKAINEKMFQTIYESNIPDKIFHEIVERLLRSSFIRTESKYFLVIEKIDQEFAKITIRHCYRVRNVSRTNSTHELTIGFDVIKKMESLYSISKIQLGGEDMNKDTENYITKETRSEVHDWWSIKKEKSVQPGEEIDCEFEIIRVSDLKGKEVICSMLPAERMSAEVFDQKNEFSVSCMSLHPLPEIYEYWPSNPCKHTWSLGGPVLPGQGILINWAPRDEVTPAALPSQTSSNDRPEPNLTS